MMKIEFTEEDIENIIHKYLQDELRLMVTDKPDVKVRSSTFVVEAKARPTADGWKPNKEESGDEL